MENRRKKLIEAAGQFLYAVRTHSDNYTTEELLADFALEVQREWSEESEELLPCPLCLTSRDVIMYVPVSDKYSYKPEVYCQNCGLSLQGEDEEDARRRWNDRPNSDTSSTDKINELWEMLDEAAELMKNLNSIVGIHVWLDAYQAMKEEKDEQYS